MTHEERYVLGCYRYIELNPVRANRVDHPARYPWSSYRANAQGEVSALLTPHSLYTGLGGDDKGRQITYRGLFHEQLDPETVGEIRAATNGNFTLGSSKFQAQVAAALGRRVTPGRSGWPRKNKEPASLHLFDEE